jgi:hypothetical protein
MFNVVENVTFVLGNNITLMGHSSNTDPMVFVRVGSFTMNAGATISGNSGTGVQVGGRGNQGTFTMNGGTISDNRNSGVIVGERFLGNGTFYMNGGVISNNNANNGGGVHMSNGAFTMTGGIIFENNANTSGGGVYVSGGPFTMRGGTITSNTAAEYGGGVFATHGSIMGSNGGIFKTNGTITGFSSNPEDGNVVRDHDGILARRGHAVFVHSFGFASQYRRETTAGTAVNLSTRYESNWEQ